MWTPQNTFPKIQHLVGCLLYWTLNKCLHQLQIFCVQHLNRTKWSAYCVYLTSLPHVPQSHIHTAPLEESIATEGRFQLDILEAMLFVGFQRMSKFIQDLTLRIYTKYLHFNVHTDTHQNGKWHLLSSSMIGADLWSSHSFSPFTSISKREYKIWFRCLRWWIA